MAAQIVTKVVFEAEERGVDKTVASLNKLDAAAGKASAGATSFGKQTAAAFAEVERAQKRSEATLNKSMAGMATPGIVKQIDQSTRAFAQIERQANNVRKAIDPVYRDLAKFEDAQKKLSAAAEAGAISWQKHGQLIEAAREKYVGAYRAVASTNDNVRLSTQQMQGLGYQINDIGTMVAMGASPFQVIASQAGQVIQVLGDGPQGMKGSLSAIGSSIAGFARSIPVAGYAVAGVTAAVGALWYVTSGPEAREAEERLKDFEGAIKRLETGWKAAGHAARDYANAPSKQALDPNATFLDVRGSAKRLKTDMKAAIDELNTSDLLSGRIIRPFAGHVSDARREIMSLYADLRTGEISAQQFADEMLRIRLDPNAEVHARNLAEEIRLALPDVIALERQVQALNQATAKMAAPKGTMGRHDLPDDYFKDRFGPTIGGDNRFGSTEAMDKIREGLQGQRDELEKTDKALRTYSDAVREQKAALAGSLAELQLQVDMFGQSEGAIAAAKFSMNALADARREAAASNSGVLDPTIEAEIGKQAEQYGRLTDQLNAASKAQQERLRVEQEATAQRKRVDEFGTDLEFQKSLLFLPQAEQQVRTTLRGLGVDFTSFEGQRLAESMRYIDSVRQQQSALAETSSLVDDIGDIFADVFSSATRGGETFFESVTRGLATCSGSIGRDTNLFKEVRS